MNAPYPHLYLAIFGASRSIGFEAVRQALAAGHQVTAVSRKGDALGARFPQLWIVEGDATDPRTVDHALHAPAPEAETHDRTARRPVDAVLCALGAPALSDSKIRSRGTEAIVAGMKRAGVRRIAAVSLMGAAETRSRLPLLYRAVIFPLYLRKPVADHEAQERILTQSRLDWTVVRSPNLTDDAVSAAYLAGVFEDWSALQMTVPRADVAHFLLRCITAAEFIREAPVVASPKARRSAA